MCKEADDTKTPCCTTCSKVMFHQESLSEMKAQWGIIWPVALTQLLQFTVLFVSLTFCGHLGKETLDGVALATTVINVTGNSVMMGLGSACDTLFSQTFGSTNKRRVGIILQRSLIIMLLCGLPCWAILMNTEHLLRLLGQDHLVARQGGKYGIIYIAVLPGQVIAIILAKYLQAQSIVLPSLLIAIGTNLLNIGFHLLFLLGLNFDIMGAALSVCLTQWLVVLFHVIYIVAKKIYRTTWDGWSIECLYEWGQFVSLALPGLFMVCLEWWSFEILFFLVGAQGVVLLAGHTIVYNSAALAFMVPLGLSVAVSVRVGNHLGAGDPEKAKTASRIAVSFAILVALIIAILTVALKDVVPYLFTNDKEVIELGSRLLLLSALFELFNCTQGAFCGVIRGIGHQKFGAITNFISYYIVALPLAIPLLLKTELSVFGVWWGVTISSALQAVVYIARILTTNWEQEAEVAQCRAGLKGGLTHEPSETVQPSDRKKLVSLDYLSASTEKNHRDPDKHCEEESIPVSNGKPGYTSITLPEHYAQDIQDNKNDYHRLSSSLPSLKWIFTTRLIVVVIFVALLIAGIVLKVFFDGKLEPENMMCDSGNSTLRLKGCDFNSANTLSNETYTKYHPHTF